MHLHLSNIPHHLLHQKVRPIQTPWAACLSGCHGNTPVRGVQTTCSTRRLSTTRLVHPHSQRYRSSEINTDNNYYVAMETGRGVQTTCSTRHSSTTRPVHPHSQRYRSSGINRDNYNYVAMETGRGVQTTCSTRRSSTIRLVHPHSQRYRSSEFNRDNNHYVVMVTHQSVGAGRLVVHGARPQHV